MEFVQSSDLEPYQKGRNVFRYTTETGDTFGGVIAKIEIKKGNPAHKARITSIHIIALWHCRIQKIDRDVRVRGLNPWHSVEPKSSLRHNFSVDLFEPELRQKRGPLILESGQQVLEISHESDVVWAVHTVEVELRSLGLLT